MEAAVSFNPFDRIVIVRSNKDNLTAEVFIITYFHYKIYFHILYLSFLHFIL